MILSFYFWLSNPRLSYFSSFFNLLLLCARLGRNRFPVLVNVALRRTILVLAVSLPLSGAYFLLGFRALLAFHVDPLDLAVRLLLRLHMSSCCSKQRYLDLDA